MTQLEDLTVTKTDYVKLKHDAIDRIKIKELTTKQEIMGHQGYSERPTPYMVQLKGENLWRRVYTTAIGNVSVIYLKTRLGTLMCETAFDEALHRAEDD
ncbi:hypothetical protein SEA_LESNORAH_22 [Microbacterium phage LesNorah]|nr:hypothetical protein SEA_BLUERUGRAT_22 [Microbacterium phage BlueRugrat]UQS94788.1 hypothetical protein SEA_LESNORAH_22 [Microbacterium phage LesNorah]